jgi:hypothetical protein
MRFDDVVTTLDMQTSRTVSVSYEESATGQMADSTGLTIAQMIR